MSKIYSEGGGGGGSSLNNILGTDRSLSLRAR